MKITLRLVLLTLILLLLVVGAQAATAPLRVPAGWEKINGAQYPTREAQQAGYTNIMVLGNALYGKPRKASATATTRYNSQDDRAVLKAALDFVKENLVNADTKVDIIITDKYSGLYFLEITLGEGAAASKIKSAVTANKKFFFPQVMDIAEVIKKSQAVNTTPAAAAAVKVPLSAKPTVELFVMSYCPYGTQMEKGLLPVVKALGGAIDFQLKFVNYTMHGDKENQENLTQYCINKTAPAKLSTYLDCFLLQADSAACLASAKIDQTAISACVASTGGQFDVKGTAFSIYDADNKKYGVQGSPTLIINGREVSTNRDSASLAKTICAAFSAGREPAACAQTFTSATPAPGFGTGTTTNSTPASCN